MMTDTFLFAFHMIFKIYLDCFGAALYDWVSLHFPKWFITFTVKEKDNIIAVTKTGEGKKISKILSSYGSNSREDLF